MLLAWDEWVPKMSRADLIYGAIATISLLGIPLVMRTMATNLGERIGLTQPWVRLYCHWAFKTAVLLFLIRAFYHTFGPAMRASLDQLTSPTEQSDVLAIIGLVLAGAVAGTFHFSYRHSPGPYINLWLGHATTFVLILAIGFLIEGSRIVLSHMPPAIGTPVNIMILTGFVAILLFDLWDLQSANEGTAKDDG